MAHTWRARDRASRALNLDLSKSSQDFRFYFDSILVFFRASQRFLSMVGIKVTTWIFKVLLINFD